MVMKEMGYKKLKQTELQLEESTKKEVERGSKKKAQTEAESVILNLVSGLGISLLQI